MRANGAGVESALAWLLKGISIVPKTLKAKGDSAAANSNAEQDRKNQASPSTLHDSAFWLTASLC